LQLGIVAYVGTPLSENACDTTDKSGGWPVYLMPPAVIPRVRVRWKIRKKIMHGSMPSNPDALCAVIFIPYCP